MCDDTSTLIQAEYLNTLFQSTLYDRGLSSLLHDQLHWLDVPEQVEYKLAVMVRRCLENKAPKYLSVHCTPVTAVSSRRLRSANQHQLIVPRCRRITIGRRAFSVAGPTVWNSLPTELRRRLSVLVTLDARLRQYYSRDISALERNRDALHNIALYKFLILFSSTPFLWNRDRVRFMLRQVRS